MRNAQELALVQAAGHERLLSPDALIALRETSLGEVSLPHYLLEQRLLAPDALERLLRELNADAFVCAGCGARASFAQLQNVPTLRCPRCAQPLNRTRLVPEGRDDASTIAGTRAGPPSGAQTATRAGRPSGALPATARRPRSSSLVGPGRSDTGGAYATHASPSDWTGRRVGDYTIERELGRGSNGVVFLATRQGLSRKFALKILRARAGFTDDETVKRFQREADLASKLDDRAVIGVYDIGRDGDLYYYAMDYCPGKDLKERLRQGPLPLREAVAVVSELARAMHRAHEQGIVHRDLKPANVILADEDGRPRITDFGLARGQGSLRSSLTKTGDIIGTPAYMAPEQFLGEADVDRRVDVYALGGILFELLTGQRAFEAPSAMELAEQVLIAEPRRLRDLDPELPAELEAVCAKALAREPADRYPTAEDLAHDLRRWRKASGRRKRPSRRTARAEPAVEPRTSRLPWVVAGVACVIVAGLVGGVVLSGSSPSTPAAASPTPSDDELGRLLSYGDTLASSGVTAGVALEKLLGDAEALVGDDPAAQARLAAARDRWALALLDSDGPEPSPEAMSLAASVAAPQGDAHARITAERDRHELQLAFDEAVAQAYALAAEPAPFSEVVAVLDALRPRLEGTPLQARLSLERLRLAQRRGQFQAVLDGVEASRLSADLAAEAELLCGLVLFRLDRADESIARLEALAAQQGETALGLTASANGLLFEGDLEGARRAAEQAIELDPGRIDAEVVLLFTAQLPEVDERRGRDGWREWFEAIRQQIERAQATIEKAPEHWRAHWGLYSVLGRARPPRDWRGGRRRGPPGRRGPWGDMPQAAEVLQRVVALTGPSSYPPAWSALCEALTTDAEYRPEDYPQAIAECERFAAVYPTRVEPWVLRAIAHAALGDRSAAAEAADRALELDSSAASKLLQRLGPDYERVFEVVLTWRE